MLRKIVGYLLLITIFGAVFAFMAVLSGVKVAVGVVVITLALVGLVALALKLIHG